MQYVAPSVTSDPSTDPAVTSKRLLLVQVGEATAAPPLHAQQADVHVVVAAALADLPIIIVVFPPPPPLQDDAKTICFFFVRVVLLYAVPLAVASSAAPAVD